MAQYASYDRSFVLEKETIERVVKASVKKLYQCSFQYMCRFIRKKYIFTFLSIWFHISHVKPDQKQLKVKSKHFYGSRMSLFFDIHEEKNLNINNFINEKYIFVAPSMWLHMTCMTDLLSWRRKQ